MTEEQALAQATEEVENSKPMIKNVDGVESEFNDADYTQAIEDRKNFLLNEYNFGYIQARQESYASILDQLDMMYWDKINGTTTWKDHITQVKEDNPKP